MQATTAPVRRGTWVTQGFDGEFTTTASVDIGSFAIEDNVVMVPPQAAAIWFNGTVSAVAPDGLAVRFIPPGCTGDSCFVEGPVEAGAFSIGGAGPDGEWSMRFFAQTAAQRGSYHVDVTVFIP